MSIFPNLPFSGLRADYASLSEFHNVAAIVAVPFNSDHPSGKPDESNIEIANRLLQLHQACPEAPLLLQREHACLLKAAAPPLNIMEYPTRHGQWVQTHILVAWFAEQLKSSENKRVALVGHPHHVRRVAALCRYYGLVPLVSGLSERVPYDLLGGQWWCCSPGLYIPWEYASRLALLLLWWRGRLPPRPG